MAEPDHARKPDEELADRGDELSEEDLTRVAGGTPPGAPFGQDYDETIPSAVG
jgi:hypothetical protein